jgi:hypothetical protein
MTNRAISACDNHAESSAATANAGDTLSAKDPLRYYIMGVVGVGKSTLREGLRTELEKRDNLASGHSFSVYEEWPEEMADEVTHAMASMSRCSAEEIQDWIFGQLAVKNQLIASDSASLQIVDRSPLDTFAFYPPQEWRQRARQMREALHARKAAGRSSTQVLAAGELLFLEGSPREIVRRMDPSRNYSPNLIAQQQSSFEVFIDWLAENFNYHPRRIVARGRTPEDLVEIALHDVIANPRPALAVQDVVEALAGGQA